MKFKVLTIIIYLVLTGCANIPIFDDNNAALDKKKKPVKKK